MIYIIQESFIELVKNNNSKFVSFYIILKYTNNCYLLDYIRENGFTFHNDYQYEDDLLKGPVKEYLQIQFKPNNKENYFIIDEDLAEDVSIQKEEENSGLFYDCIIMD